jgi:hypothetical protein
MFWKKFDKIYIHQNLVESYVEITSQHTKF